MIYSPVALSLISLLYTTTAVHASVVFTVNCDPLTVQRSDPIVSPGVASGHVHAISGGTAFNRTMLGNDSAVNAKATTCDKFTDHSNYVCVSELFKEENNNILQWCPQLYHQSNNMFEIVPYTGVNIYYKNYTCSYKEEGNWCDNPTDARAFPPGLRMVAGSSTRRTLNISDQNDQAILFETGNDGEVYTLPSTLSAGLLSFHVRFPSCWDGVNVDSPDHKSHVAYPDPTRGDTRGGICPKSHPVALISLGAEFGFDTGALGLTTSDGLVLSNGDKTGYGFHGDFLQGWTNLTALQNSFANCIGAGADCAWNSFGTPNGQQGQESLQTLEIPAPEEDIGLNGPISQLPGNNPVYAAGSPTSTQLSASISSVSSVISSPTSIASTLTTLNVVSTKTSTKSEPTLTTLIIAGATPTTLIVSDSVSVIVSGATAACHI